MPARLTGLTVLLSCAALLNLVSGQRLAAVLGVLLMAGWVKGSEGTRYALIAVSGAGLVVTSILLLGEVGTSAVPAEAVAGLLTGVAANAFGVWCLRKIDEAQWMVRPSHPDAFREAWRATGTSATAQRLAEHRALIAIAVARRVEDSADPAAAAAPDEQLVGSNGTRIWEGGLPEAVVVEATVAIPPMQPER